MTHDELVIVGPSRWRIAPDPRADIVGQVRVSVRGGGLRESTVEVPGQDGVVSTKLGYSPAEVTVEVRVADFGQLDRIRRFAEVYRNRRGAEKHTPVQLVHPATHRWGIREVYLVDLEEAPLDWREGYRLTLRFQEWWPETKTKKAAKQQGGGAGDEGGLLGQGVSVLEVDRPSKSPPPPPKR
ncbi:hypothetical protein [Thermus brockianus]|uniref:Uncharacterized protein n=1 Tax=Thermus brockianus TaxID=56956 RepID=A0ABN6NKL3_THEBO|nr:hypothetical protein [Thermus brockianus]BDG16947.1 hypothetical protein TbrSNM41_16810 [Thermus brockianus]